VSSVPVEIFKNGRRQIFDGRAAQEKAEPTFSRPKKSGKEERV
jgi:hypothetical protein